MTSDLLALAASAALFGGAGGLHCAAMCGPLAACVVRPEARGGEVASVVGRYHLARGSGYVVAGGLAGALGGGVSAGLGGPLGAGVPWAMALLLVLQAAGVLPKLKGLPWLGARVNQAARRASLWAPGARAFALGALTPLLPCGLLLAMYGLALGAGSAARGAVAMGAFALGSALPLLAAQVGWRALRQSAPRHAASAQKLLLLVAAATLLWRGWRQFSGADCCPSP